MEPLFFGQPERHLYGVYHPPARPGRRSAVLLCYPSVQEYMRVHWAFRRLAGMLSNEGFAVLRFDYYGTGDSAGEYRDANVACWTNNICEAADELCELADVREVSAVGLQLGATLAAHAVADGLVVKDLVLWEPVASGRAYIRGLRRLETLKYETVRQGPRVEVHELLGFDFSPAAAADLASVSLLDVTTCAAERIAIYASGVLPAHAALMDRLRDRRGNPPQIHIIPEQAETGVGGVLLAPRALQAITTALALSDV